MPTRVVGIIMHGATSRIGSTQHLANALVPIRAEGGLAVGGDRVVPRLVLVGRDAQKLATGILVTVPVPVADELPRELAERAIAQAVADANTKGIAGKALTPFLLARVSELTAGRSRAANTSLLNNNARVAAQIAVAVAASCRNSM